MDVAAERCSLEEAVLSGGADSLDILPLGGSGDGQIVALMSSAPLRRVIHRCRRRYDTLVIDAPSVMEALDVRELGSLADATLMIAAWQADPTLLAKALEGFDKRKVRLVFNRTEAAPKAPAVRSPPVLTDVRPVLPEGRASRLANATESTRRMGRRRSAFGKAG
jgi:MinD-like ATPase involved in chromosome partitioning or flagellar assembly